MAIYFDDFFDDLDMELLNEFDAPDAPAQEDEGEEEFSMDDGGGGDDTPPPAEDGDEGTDDGEEEFSMDEDEGDDPPPEDDNEGEEEDYEIPDDEAEEEEEGGDEPPAEDGDGEEEFSMDDEGGEEGSDAPADDTGDDEPTGDTETESKLKELENVIFDDLTDDEKKMKSEELKELYITVYKKCGSIYEMLTGIRKDEETIQIIEYISNTLIDLKAYVNDYINKVYDNKTYIENLAQLQKYIMIFNAISKVFEQIKSENEE